jgi:hypothetical protein
MVANGIASLDTPAFASTIDRLVRSGDGWMNLPLGLVVLGLGSDLCNIKRIENSTARFGDHLDT